MRGHTKDNWLLLGVAVLAALILGYFHSLAFGYALYLLGGAILAAAPFDRKRVRSRWARCLLGISAALLVIDGAVGLLRQYGVWVPSLTVQRGLPYTMATIEGVVLGFFIALAFSGELAGTKPSRNEQIA